MNIQDYKEHAEYYNDTIEHIKIVKDLIRVYEGVYLDDLRPMDAVRLMVTCECHDQSKLFNNAERDGYIKLTHDLKDVKYGTPEYFDIINSNKCVEIHYQNNSHHPEHHVNGIADMEPHQLVDMVCDWMAAHGRKNKSFDNFNESMEFNRKRFNINDDLFKLLQAVHLAVRTNKRVVPTVYEYIK